MLIIDAAAARCYGFFAADVTPLMLIAPSPRRRQRRQFYRHLRHALPRPLRVMLIFPILFSCCSSSISAILFSRCFALISPR